MGKVVQYSRQLQHRLSTTGLTFSVAPNDDHTGGSWSSTDLYVGELGINITDDRIWMRTNNGLVELKTAATVSNTGELWQSSGGYMKVLATFSSNTVAPVSDTGQSLGDLTYRWDNVTSQELTIFGSTSGFAGSQWKFMQDNKQTTTATPDGFGYISLSDGEMITVEARINGFKSDYTKSYGSTIFGVFYKTGGIVYQVNTSDIVEKYNFTTATTDCLINGTTGIYFKIVGEGGTTINWSVSYNYHKTLNNI